MKRLAYLLPVSFLSFTVIGCGDDAAGATDGSDTESDDDDDSTTTGSTTLTTTTTTTEGSSSTTLDPSETDPSETLDTSTTDPEGSTTVVEGCTEQDECIEAEDCEGSGMICIGCTCLPDPNAVCPDGWGEGTFADCRTDPTVCAANETCVGDDAGAMCLALNMCEAACDCPQPPKGFEDAVECGQANAGDDLDDCFISCENGDPCPEGNVCLAGFICVFGEPPPAIPDYGDCVNDTEGQCENGLCLVDDTVAPTEGVCTPDCMDSDDCPAPGSGTAMPSCEVLGEDGAGNDINGCLLQCDDMMTCPDGMACLPGGFCSWETPAPPAPGYNDCINNPDGVCGEDGGCIVDEAADPDTGVCADGGCMDPLTDCPDAPATGMAPIACIDIDGLAGDECALDCSAMPCPDGMVCSGSTYCTWESQDLLLFEDFEDGGFNAGWTAVDVDGLPPDANIAFVGTSWSVQSQFDDDGNFSAYSGSWFNPAGTADNWLVSPAVTVSGTSMLTWDARAQDPMFPDGYEVYVGTSPDPAVLVMGTPVFTVAGEAVTYTAQSADLSAFAGMDVHIAWRNNSNDQFVLLVDNISVTP